MLNRPHSDAKSSLKISSSDYPAVILILLAFLIMSISILYKYWNFNYWDWDLALYANAMWNLAHGSLKPSIFGVNFLANHCNYIAFLILPFYIFFQYPLTLVFLKLLSFLAGSFVFYKICRRSLPTDTSLVLLFLFLVYPVNLFAMLFEFDFESLNFVLLFLSWYFFIEQKFRNFILSLLVLFLIKENQALIGITYGIFALFFRKEGKLKWTLTPILLGLIVFYLNLAVIIPHLRSEFHSAGSIYWGLYNNWGATPIEIIRNLIFHPVQFIKLLFSDLNGVYLFELFAPLLFLPLLQPHIVLLTAPIFLQNILASTYSLHTIYFHYSATIGVFVFLAFQQAVTIFRANLRRSYFYLFIILILIISLANLRFHSARLLTYVAQDSREINTAKWKMIHQIPKNQASLVSTNFLTPLSQRDNVYPFLHYIRGYNAFDNKPFELSKNIDYVLIDFFTDTFIDHALDKDPKGFERMQNLIANPEWGILDAADETVLFKRGFSNPIRLVEKSTSPFNEINFIGQTVKNEPPGIKLMGYSLDTNTLEQPNRLHCIFYWKAEKDISTNYGLEIELKAAAQKTTRVIKRKIGYDIYPTQTWKKGEYIKEHYWIVSNSKPENSELKFSFLH